MCSFRECYLRNCCAVCQATMHPLVVSHGILFVLTLLSVSLLALQSQLVTSYDVQEILTPLCLVQTECW